MIQLKNAAACFNDKFTQCEEGMNWSVEEVGCVPAKILSPIVQADPTCPIDFVISKR
jgi:hypothetical protein